MSNQPNKKKRVVTTGNKREAGSKAVPARSRATDNSNSRELTFSRDNYLWMGIGFVLVIIGMMLMSGGHMPSPDVWDEELIYSTRRTVLAPIVILAGLAVEVYAIFK